MVFLLPYKFVYGNKTTNNHVFTNHILKPLAADRSLANQNGTKSPIPSKFFRHQRVKCGQKTTILYLPLWAKWLYVASHLLALYIVSLYKSIYKHHINIANISADKEQDNFYHMVIYNADHKLKTSNIHIYI